MKHSHNTLFSILALIVALAATLPMEAQDLKGDINGDGKVNDEDVTALVNLVLSYSTAPTESATYCTTLSSGSDYSSTSETYVRYDITAGDDSCDIHIFNVQFASSAPKLAHISLHAGIAKSADGYTLTGEGITPTYHMSSTISVPFTRGIITGLKGDISTSALTASLSFNCMGGSWSNESAIVKQ